jgi:putative nucleotidyltransferase with HDIG domain
MTRKTREPFPDLFRRISAQRRDIGRAASWLAMGIILLVLRPPAEPSDIPLFDSGQVADKTILAPFTFRVMKSDALLEEERAAAATREYPVFRPRDGVLASALEKVETLQASVTSWLSREDSLVQLEEMPTPGFTLSEATRSLLALPPDSSRLFEASKEALSSVLSRFVAASNRDIGDFQQFVLATSDSTERVLPADSLRFKEDALLSLGTSMLQKYPNEEPLARAVYELVAPLITPTVVFDAVETARRRSVAAAAVSPIKGTLLAGEIVVEAHYRVTDDDIDELRSLRAAYAERAKTDSQIEILLPVLGHILWVGLFLAILALFLRGLARPILAAPGDTALLMLIIAVFASVSYSARWGLGLPATAIPFAMVGMLATVFFNVQVGFGLSMLSLLLAASHFRFEIVGLVAPLAGALVAVFRLRKLRRRGDFFVVAVLIFGASSLAGVTTGLLASSSADTLLRVIGMSAANAAASGLIVMVAFPLLETLFDKTTDLRLLELSDMNHILLRQLALEAPGTYHHSIIVGNMAEAACEAIGANALLARVGSYFHDIGKLTKPHYFSENQTPGANPHDKLSPKMSALVIASHVKEGLKLAQQEKLPPAIVDFVAEHHGRTSISFFYKRMKEQNPDARVNPEDFAYPGPRPRSRETAVVMLADAAEGAVRALEEPTATRISQAVQKVMHERLTAGQLDESNLTFHDLGRIRESFVPILVGVHHHRVKYPEGKKEEQGE